MPEEIQSDFVDRNLTRALELRPGNARKFPAAVDDTIIGTVPLWSTSSLETLLLDSKTVVGTGPFETAETTPVLEGLVQIPIAIELSHTDTVTRRMWFSLKWDRAGVTSTVALTTVVSVVASVPIAVEDLSRLYLGPTFRIHASIELLAVGKTMTLKVAYVERNLGETFPA